MTKAIKWFVLLMGRGKKIKKRAQYTSTNELIISRKEKKNMRDVAAQNTMKRCIHMHMHTAQHGSRQLQNQLRN